MADIRKSDLLNLIANEVGGHTTPKKVERFLSALRKVILEELEMNGSIQFKEFGKFELREIGGVDRKFFNIATGRVEIVYQTPKYILKFKPSKVLLGDINERGFKERPKTTPKRRKTADKTVVRTKRPSKPKPTLEQDFVELLNVKFAEKEDE